MKPRKVGYYARALATLARTVARRRQLLQRLWRPAGVLELRDGMALELAQRRDLLILKETICDDVYGLRALARGARMIVDVGASVGDFTIAAARAHPGCRVLAFEPDPSAFRLLCVNVRRNRVPNVELHQVALGSRSLGAFVDHGDVDLLKVDCEGAELDVLAGAPLPRVRRVVVEYHGSARGDAVQALLRDAGFAVRRRPDPYDRDLGYLEAERPHG